MSDKKDKSIVEVLIDVVVESAIKDIQECLGDEKEKYSNIELPEEEDK